MFKIPIHGGVDLFGSYKNKVYSGGGSIRNEFVAKTILNFYKNSGQLNNLRLLVAPELGMTLFNDGTDLTVSKLYSVDSVPNDVSQTTAGNQPYLAGDIAPTEKYCLNNPNGATRYMTHPEISYGNTDKWNATYIVYRNGKTGKAFLIGNNSATLSLFGTDGNNYTFTNQSGTTVKGTYSITKTYGKITVVSIVATGSQLLIYENGILVETLTVATDFIFSKIIAGDNGTTNIFNGKLYYKKTSNGEASAYFVKDEYDMLRSIFPEIESVTIGTQTWATSNFEAVATPRGNIIPEQQNNTTWADSTNIYNTTYASTSGTAEQKEYAALKAAAMWCYYTTVGNDADRVKNGAIYGKLYNWYAVKLLQTDIDAYNTANPTNRWGWHVPTYADFTTLQTYLGGASVAGGKLKKEGLQYWNTPNTGATNESGFSAISGGYRQTGGTFYSNRIYSVFWGIQETNSPYILLYYNTEAASVGLNDNKLQGFSLRLIKD